MFDDLVLFVYLVFFSMFIFILWYVSKKYRRDSPIFIFVEKILSLPALFLPFGIYLTYKVLKMQIDNIARDGTFKIIDRGWILINKSLSENYDKCPYFINSIYYDWQKKEMTKTYTKNTNKPNNDNWATVNYISTIMFQSWEDFLTSLSVDQTGSVVWMANYLQWSQSKELKKIWDVSKPNYAIGTQLFGDFLFSQKDKPKNADELQSLAQKCVDSKEYNDIITKK